MKKIYIMTTLLFALGCNGEKAASVEPTDYETLKALCDGNSCCEASVKAAQKANGTVIGGAALGDVELNGADECPEGQMRNMMKCVSSYSWCEAK